MKKTLLILALLIIAVVLLICTNCERFFSKQAPYKVEVAVTAEQLKASEEKMKAEEHIRAVSSNVANGKISSDANKAFTDIYGGLIWNDKILAQYFQGKTIGYLAPVFEERFTEGGLEKLLVLGRITPEPTESYFCHACYPLLGGAIFHKQGSLWVVESAKKIIGWGGSLSPDVISIFKIGPTKYGVSIRFFDVHQGYEVLKEMILVPNQGHLDVVLDVGYSDKPGPGVCLEDNINLPNQNVDIKFEPGINPEYFDAVVHIEYNDGACGHKVKWVAHKETTRYQFKKGRYIGESTEETNEEHQQKVNEALQSAPNAPITDTDFTCVNGLQSKGVDHAEAMKRCSFER
jgi:hypothetical protein